MRGKTAAEGDQYTSANGYNYTKVDGRWRLTHHIIAEEHILGRPLTENETVRFKSKNKADLRPDNLLVVTKGKQSLRRRKAQLEARIAELQAQLADVDKRLEAEAAIKV
jgi:hypothetical protein